MPVDSFKALLMERPSRRGGGDLWSASAAAERKGPAHETDRVLCCRTARRAVAREDHPVHALCDGGLERQAGGGTQHGSRFSVPADTAAWLAEVRLQSHIRSFIRR